MKRILKQAFHTPIVNVFSTAKSFMRHQNYAKKLLGEMLTADAKYENKETIIIQRGK